MSEHHYVHSDKFIVLVETDDAQMEHFKSMLEQAGYLGTLKTFKRTESAVKYLNRTVSESGLLVAADLLIFSFDISEHDI